MTEFKIGKHRNRELRGIESHLFLTSSETPLPVTSVMDLCCSAVKLWCVTVPNINLWIDLFGIENEVLSIQSVSLKFSQSV